MADKEKELKVKFESVTLEDQPDEYLKTIFAEAANHQDEKLQAINIENRAFYEGHDEQLEARGADKMVIRSSLFINEGKPAVDTRTASVLTKIEEDASPIVVKPRSPSPTQDEKDQAAWISATLTQQLRDAGYLSTIFEEHITGSEIYRSPSTVKVGWESETIQVPSVIEPSEQEQLRGAVVNQNVPVTRVEFRDKKIGRPFVEYLDPDEFLYDPHCSSLERDCNYTIHAGYEFYHDIVSMAKDLGWDVDKVKNFKDQLSDDTDIAQTSDTESIRDKIRNKRDNSAPDRGFRDGKILLAEFFIKTYNDQGARQVRHFVFMGNREIIYDKTNDLKGITHPFVVARSNPLPGTLENFSSIDLIKRLGRMVNESCNLWVDSITYSLFSVLKADADVSFPKGQPVMGPGSILYLSPNKEAIEPINVYQPHVPDLTNLLGFFAERIRQLLNSPDLAEGFNATPNEKATSVKIRSAGTARRFVPINRRYGEALVGVAEMFYKLNIQFHEEASRFVLKDGVTIDAPGLTNITDPERLKEEEMVLLAQMLQNPLYQNPTGIRKIRNQMYDLVRALKANHVDLDAYVPTTDELESQIQIDTEKEKTQIDLATVSAQAGQQPQ